MQNKPKRPKNQFTFKKVKDNFFIQGVFFFWPPTNLAMSQAHYKFLYLENFRGGGQFKLYRAWDLVKLGGARKKITVYLPTYLPTYLL